MQKLILCSMILMLGLSQAQAADEAADAPESPAYVPPCGPIKLNLSGGKRLTFMQISDALAESTRKFASRRPPAPRV